jgi:hypothetical protein
VAAEQLGTLCMTDLIAGREARHVQV